MSQTLTIQYEIEIKQLKEELKEETVENKTELEKLKLIVSRRILIHVQNFDTGYIFHCFVDDIVGIILILFFLKQTNQIVKEEKLQKELQDSYEKQIKSMKDQIQNDSEKIQILSQEKVKYPFNI